MRSNRLDEERRGSFSDEQAKKSNEGQEQERAGLFVQLLVHHHSDHNYGDEQQDGTQNIPETEKYGW